MDQYLISVGEYGFYQKSRLLVIGLISSLTAMTIYSTIFSVNQAELNCKSKTNLSLVLNKSDSCNVWSKLNELVDYECKIDDSFYYGLVNEWLLVCDKAHLVDLTQTLYMIGRICGLPIGFFADRYGRKQCGFILACLLFVVLIILETSNLTFLNFSFQVKFVIYCISQFLIGILAKAIYLVLYILLIETTTSKNSTLVSNINLYLYVLGQFFVLMIAYFFRNWHIMNITMAIYSLITLFFIGFYIDESPRYLFSKGSFKKAHKLLNKIARINKNQQINIEFELFEYEAKKMSSSDEKNDEAKTTTSLDKLKEMWTPRSNLIKTTIFIYVWLSLNLIYYGISLGITNIDAYINPYIMYILSSFAEITGYVSCHLNDRYGRKIMIIIFLILSSIVCMLVAILPSSNNIYLICSKMFLVFIGKASASAAFNSFYIYNSLLYSTAVRSTIVLFASNLGNIGSLISPTINSLRFLVWQPLPFMIFSASSFLASVFILILPDPDKTQFI